MEYNFNLLFSYLCKFMREAVFNLRLSIQIERFIGYITVHADAEISGGLAEE
jgi:hypothetical protein